MRGLHALAQACLATASMGCTLVGDLGDPPANQDAVGDELGDDESGEDEEPGPGRGEVEVDGGEGSSDSDSGLAPDESEPPPDLGEGEGEGVDDTGDESCMVDCAELPGGSIVISEITGSSNPEIGGWLEFFWTQTRRGCLVEGLQLRFLMEQGEVEQVFELPAISMSHERAIVGEGDFLIGVDVPSDRSVEVGGLLVPGSYRYVILGCHLPTPQILDVVDGLLVAPGQTMCLDDTIEVDLATQNDKPGHWCARPSTPALPNGACPDAGAQPERPSWFPV